MKVLLGSAFGVLTTIAYRSCVSKHKIFATKSSIQHLLTIMCASSRFPEAVPLRNIKTKTIVKALSKFSLIFDLPKSIQSNQGSNFTSGLFQQVMLELGIKQICASAYHPESQGALERFHQTLKNMIRSYCFDTKKTSGMREFICFYCGQRVGSRVARFQST